MSAKRGRPISENPKDKRLELRLTKNEFSRIENCSKELKKSKAQTLLYGLELVESEIKKK